MTSEEILIRAATKLHDECLQLAGGLPAMGRGG